MAAGLLLLLRSLRRATLVSAALDLAVAALGAAMAAAVLRGCGWRERAPAAVASGAAAAKITAMAWAGIKQGAAASVVAARSVGDARLVEDDDFRRLRKVPFYFFIFLNQFYGLRKSLSHCKF